MPKIYSSLKCLQFQDAININKWRFSRLKQYNDGEIEAENEAFERYMENVRLLEETFHTGELVKSEELITSETDSSAEKVQKLISEIKVKLKSNAERAESIRKRVRNLVDQKLGNLQSAGLVDDENFSGTDDLDGDNVAKRAKIEKWRVERTVAVDALIDKLNKARSEDDLKSCLETKQLLFNQTKNMDDLLSHLCSHSLCNKTYTAVDVNQDSLANVNAEFSALDQVAEL